MNLRIIFAGVSLLAVASASWAEKLEEDARAFGARDNVIDVSISPSGSKAMMLVAGPGKSSLVELADLNSGQIVNLTRSEGNPQAFRWCNFAGETHLVCLHSGIEPFDKYLVNHAGLVTIDTGGKSMKSLRPKARFERQGWASTYDGAVIDWLPGQDGALLMARSHLPQQATGTILAGGEGGLAVERVDLRSLKFSKVEQPRGDVYNYMTDGRGNVRLMFISDDDHRNQLTGKTKIRYRTKDSRSWRDLGEYDGVRNEGFNMLSVDADSDSAYALKKTNGRDALYRVKLDESLSATLVGSDPAVDIDGVITLGPGQKVIGYTFAHEYRRGAYFDPDFQKLQSSLARAIPNQPQISFSGASSDGQKLLVLASGDTHPGTFYIFDRPSKRLAELVQVRPQLQGRALAAMRPIAFKASDGTNIPAYLTLPAGSSGKNLPAVVLPHGGPEARDEWGFDWLSQFLAARGYAVIQPNFRGSAGYGEAWLAQNGFRSWKTSIGDVTSAAKYLVAEGIADPDKLAVVGWSYGGYAALQSVAVEPDLYKAAVAIAPVTDLAMVKDEARDFNNAKLIRDYVGSGPHVAEGSPLRNVAAIKAPVLLVHGDQDINVGIGQSDRMNAALKAQGKRVEYLRFDNLDHQLDDSEARIRMLMKIGSFLDGALGK